MDEHASLAADRHHFGHRLHRADFVVGPLHVHQRGVGSDGGADVVDIDASHAIDRNDDGVTGTRGAFADGRMLHRGEDLVRAACCCAPTRRRDRFGRAGREDHFT
jgi:hypothetical protein